MVTHDSLLPAATCTRPCKWLALATTGAATGAAPARAQTWPAAPVHIVVPFAAGAAPDVVTPMHGGKLAQGLGAMVLVETS